MSNEQKMIYLCLAHMSDEGLEQKYIKEAFDTNWVVPLGPNVNAFEADLKQFVGKDQQEQEKEVKTKETKDNHIHKSLRYILWILIIIVAIYVLRKFKII